MRPCHVVEIVTPKKVLLNGLWFGPKKPKQALIFIHGLTASAFSMGRMRDAFVDSNTAVLVFNNRGYEKVTEVKQKIGAKYTWKNAGATYEKFTECADDIQGAVNFTRRQGVQKIYLVGHSTGCQKAYYWASRKKGGRGVKGIVLLAPLSDYAEALRTDERGRLNKAVAHAKKLVKGGRPYELMPENLGPWFLCSAQRFLSLYTSNSAEEIFSYTQPRKNPRTLKAVRVPTFVLFAGADEHTDRPAEEMVMWFEDNLRVSHRVIIIPRVNHGFRGAETRIARVIRQWMKSYR